MSRTRRAPLPLLGAHVSVAGGLVEGVRRGTELACDALQIFVKSPSQWQSKPLLPEDAEAFRAAHAASAIGPVVAHAAYLINLAAPDPQILARSRAALADELRRCAALGVAALVVHPGAHLGAGEEAGLTAIARSLDAVDGELGDMPDPGAARDHRRPGDRAGKPAASTSRRSGRRPRAGIASASASTPATPLPPATRSTAPPAGTTSSPSSTPRSASTSSAACT